MRKLLFSLTKKDFRIDYFRAGGKGGQKQNKTSSGCRITHIQTGIAAEGRDTRSKEQNKRNAFDRLWAKPEFQAWFKTEVARRLTGAETEEQIERLVDEMLEDKNLKIEVFNAKTGKWEPVTD